MNRLKLLLLGALALAGAQSPSFCADTTPRDFTKEQPGERVAIRSD